MCFFQHRVDIADIVKSLTFLLFNLPCVLFVVAGLSHTCGKTVRSATLMSVKNLQSADSRSVRLITVRTTVNSLYCGHPRDRKLLSLIVSFFRN